MILVAIIVTTLAVLLLLAQGWRGDLRGPRQ